MKERKNLGPAIKPTAVTNKAVPMLETIPKLPFIFSLKREIISKNISNFAPNLQTDQSKDTGNIMRFRNSPPAGTAKYINIQETDN